MTVQYITTRGGPEKLSFADILLKGVAADGGLYVPDSFPKLDFKKLEPLAYPELAEEILKLFTGDAFTKQELAAVSEKAHAAFTHPDVTPLTPLAEGLYSLELFHGPTLAFKDYALQLLGGLLNLLLRKRGTRTTIVGATSGDTGSAAIEAFKGAKNVDVFILHPHGRVSEIQRRQMTAQDVPNVHNIAVEGTFDDCQAIVKTLFLDEELLKITPLSAVNSINMARILAQTVYYVRAFLTLGTGAVFAVPTGNFGDILAGYYARRMGVPAPLFLLASNENDILPRFLETGVMERRPVAETLSPSMDIQISSNFERLLFDVSSGEEVRELMKSPDFAVSPKIHGRISALFKGYACRTDETLATIRAVYEETGVILDPHSATAVYAARLFRAEHPGAQVVSLATAHPAKFPGAIERAIGRKPDEPAVLEKIRDLPEKYVILPASSDAVKNFIIKELNS